MFDAMEPIGLDTLKATRSLEAAGFDAAKAEALVTVLGGPVSGTAATREDVRDLRVEMRAEFRDVRTEFKAGIESCRTEFKAGIEGIEGCRSELKAEIGQLRDESVETRSEIARLSREMAEARLEARGNVTKAQMYRLLLVQATVIVGLIVGLERLL
jgi:hypothetical protein